MREVGQRLERTTAVIAVAVLAFSIAAAGADKKNAKPQAPQIDTSKLEWPPRPLQPRIKWMGAYRGQSDFKEFNKKKSGWLERAAGIVPQEQVSDMMKPFGVAVDSKGAIYITDGPLNSIFVFDIEAKKVSFISPKTGVDLLLPTGIAIDDQDRIFVTEAFAHQVVCLSTKGEVIRRFGEKELKRAGGVAVDNALRRVYVIDPLERRIAVFDEDNFKFQSYLADPSKLADKGLDAEGKLGGPSTIAVDGEGLIYVVDSLLNRVTVFNTDGTFVRRMGAPGFGAGGFQRAKGVAVDTDGHVYVSDTTSSTVQMFDANGQPMMPIGGAGFEPGRFAAPAGITVDRLNRLIVVEQQSPRIQVFRYFTDEEVAAKTPAATGKEGEK